MDELKTPEKPENEGTNQSKEFQSNEVSIKIIFTKNNNY